MHKLMYINAHKNGHIQYPSKDLTTDTTNTIIIVNTIKEIRLVGNDKTKVIETAYTLTRIPKPLWLKARHVALERGITMRELLLQALTAFIAKEDNR